MITHSSERSIGRNLRVGYVYSSALSGASMQPQGLPAIERQKKARAHIDTVRRIRDQIRTRVQALADQLLPTAQPTTTTGEG